MAVLLAYAGIIAGFAFPVFLIQAIRAKNEDTAAGKTLLACLCFGICALAMILF